VLAFMDRDDPDHETVRTWLLSEEHELVTTPLIVAELDHLLLRRAGVQAARRLREDVDDGAYQVEWWPNAIRESIAVARRYESMPLGLSDASLVALAAHVQTTTIATLDERHFRALKPLSGGEGFTLLPADAGSG
jgi:uncharacterized protein